MSSKEIEEIAKKIFEEVSPSNYILEDYYVFGAACIRKGMEISKTVAINMMLDGYWDRPSRIGEAIDSIAEGRTERTND